MSLNKPRKVKITFVLTVDEEEWDDDDFTEPVDAAWGWFLDMIYGEGHNIINAGFLPVRGGNHADAVELDAEEVKR